VPGTIFLGIIWHIWQSQASALSLAVYGIGLLLVAGYSHHLYVQRNFVERGDAALAWSFVAWSVALIPVASPIEGIQTWCSLLLICAALDFTLRMHRQPSTSNIQFRAGLAAGLAVSIQPLNVGLLLGLIAVQMRSRPLIMREWVMLTFGVTHGVLLAEVGWSFIAIDDLVGASAENIGEGIVALRDSWSAIAMGAAGLFGLFMFIREDSRLVLKTKNTRYNTFITLALLAATGGAFCWMAPMNFRGVNSLEHAISHWSVIAALTLGFLSVSLVPKRDRRSDKLGTLDAMAWIVFVGTLLVVFGLRSFQ